MFSFFKPTAPTNAWLNRQAWTDRRGALTANAQPDVPPYTGSYSEILQDSTNGMLTASNVDYNDYIYMTRGNNRGQFRSVAAFNPASTTYSVGTQEGLARTAINHVIGDEFEIVEPIQISTDDTMVVVLDQNPTANTIDINMSRTGQINSGSSALTFLPTTTEFSATDYDNQPDNPYFYF